MEDYVDCPSPAEQQVPHRAWRPVRNDITRNGHPDLRGVTARLEAAPFSKQRVKATIKTIAPKRRQTLRAI
jgi:hypothetical protein